MRHLFIRGEAGKALDETKRFFHEIAEGGTLRFANQTDDILNIAIAPKFITGSGASIPEVGQEITLEINDDRVFKGIVTGVPASLGGDGMTVNVTVSGPWWWLDNTPITEEITEAERPQFECPKGDLRGNLIAILNRAISKGLPIAIGTIDACYDVPTVTFQGGSFADAISELVRLVPDAVLWWDYSGTGHPKLNLTRRDAENPTTMRVGVDEISSLSLNPEWGLKVSEVSVPYASRAENGSIQYLAQSSDQSGSGQRQVIAVSGPELTDFVPPDPIESKTITSKNPFSTGSEIDDTEFNSVWPWWQQMKDLHSGDTPPNFVEFASASMSAQYPNGLVPDYYHEDGTVVVAATAARFVVKPAGETLPDWLIEKLGLVKGYHKGTWMAELVYGNFEDPWTEATDLEREVIQSAAHFYQVTYTPMTVRFFFDLNFEVYFMASEVTSQTHYQPLAYDYETPPADFAKNLRDAQNWLPYSGGVTLDREDHGFSRMMGKTIKIEGGLPPWETMGALVQGESYDLFSQRQEIELGVPARLSGTTPVHRVNRQGSDSIVIN